MAIRLPTLWQVAGYAAYGLFLLLNLKLTWPLYVAFRRRRSGFGRVFNSVTEKSEALVTVALKDLHGRIVRTNVSDKDGRYRLLVQKGEYTVEVSKPGYTFPSKLVTKEHNETTFDNILTSNHIIVKDYGAITKNIPIDPPIGTRKPAFWSLRFHPGKKAMSAILYSGPLVAVGFLWLQYTSITAWILFICYLAVLLGRYLSFKPPEPPFGTIRDAVTGKPLDQAIVRIFDTKYNKLLETQITSPKGRYAFIVNRGSFRIWVKRQGYKNVVVNFPQIKKDGTLLAKDIKLQRAPEQSIQRQP
jgi:hypothetical protein